MNVYACIPLNTFTLMLGQIKMQSVIQLYKHRKIMAIEAEETQTAKEVRSFLCIPFYPCTAEYFMYYTPPQHCGVFHLGPF